MSADQRRKRIIHPHIINETLSDNPLPNKRLKISSLAGSLVEYLQERSWKLEICPKVELFVANLKPYTKKNLFQIFQIYGKITWSLFKSPLGLFNVTHNNICIAIGYDRRGPLEETGIKISIQQLWCNLWSYDDHGKNSSSTHV